MGFIAPTAVLAAATGLFLAYRLGIILYRLFFHPLSGFPGPKLFASSALPQFFYQNICGTFYRDVRDMHDKYGSIIRVAPNELSIDGSVGWADVYGHRKAGEPEWKKDKLFYRPADNGEGFNGSGVDDIFTANRESHRRQRRVISHAFSESALSEQEDIIQRYIDLLMARFKEMASKGRPANMVEWFNFTTFDIIGDLTFGESFKCLETSTMHPWIRLIFPLIKLASYLRPLANYPFLKPLLPLLISKKELETTTRSMAFTQDKLEKRIALGKNTERKDFMTYILRHNDEKGLHHQEIMSNSEALIIAGSETTATLLSSLTYYLARHSTTWQRLTAEVRGSFDTEKDITMRSSAALPYLHACLEEGLRIYPPAAQTPPRISPGATIDGQFIPEGTRIWLPQWSTCHRESNFHLADEFHPERWLPSSHTLYDRRFENDNKSSMQPFATGSRNCIGKNLAYAEMRVIVARMAWNFELELTPQSENWLDGQKVFTVFQKPPLFMKLHARVG